MLSQKVFTGYFGKLIALFINLVGGMIVARLVGPSELGKVAFALSFISIFTFLCDFGTGTVHLTIIPQKENYSDYLGTFVFLKILFIILFSVFSFASLIIFKNTIFHNLSSDYYIISLITLISVIFSQLNEIANSHFIAKTEQAKQEVIRISSSGINQFLRLTFSAVGFKAIGLSIAYMFSLFFTIPLSIKWLVKEKIGIFQLKKAKEYLILGLPILFISIFSTGTEYLDKVIIQFYASSYELGLYSFSQNISSMIKMGIQSAGLLFIPTFSFCLVKNNYDDIFGIIKKFEKFIVFIAMPLLFSFFHLSNEICLILGGKKFYDAGPVMGFLILSILIFGLNHPFDNLLAAQKRFTTVAVIAFFRNGFFLLLLFASIKYISIQPSLIASICILITNIIFGFFSRFIVYKSLQRRNKLYLFFGKEFFVIQLIFMLSLCISFILTLIYHSLFSRIVGLFSFLILVLPYLFVKKKLFLTDTILVFKNILPNKLIKYIKSEL